MPSDPDLGTAAPQGRPAEQQAADLYGRPGLIRVESLEYKLLLVGLASSFEFRLFPHLPRIRPPFLPP